MNRSFHRPEDHFFHLAFLRSLLLSYGIHVLVSRLVLIEYLHFDLCPKDSSIHVAKN
jgi:hypothetical protein